MLDRRTAINPTRISTTDMVRTADRVGAALLKRLAGLALLSATSIGLSLFVLGTFGIVTYNIDVTLQAIERRVEVVAYLRDDVTAAQLEVIQSDVRSYPEVEEVAHLSKFEAMREAMQQLDEFRDVFTDLEMNPLPASIEVRLKPGFRNPEAVEHVAQLIGLYPFVEDVRYGREWVNKIFQLRRLGGAVAAILGIAFAVVAILIIGTTVRMAVLARRDEIAVMRLVGATPAFVRGPFLVAGMAQGLVASIVALAVVEAVRRAALAYAGGSSVALLDLLVARPLSLGLSGLLLAVGLAVSLAGSHLAVRQSI